MVKADQGLQLCCKLESGTHIHNFIKMSREKYASPGKWGESKRRVNIMLTPYVTDLIDKVAGDLGVSRSEYIEQLLRKEVSSQIKTS